MKKSILNLGNALSRAEQKKINGGIFEDGIISWDDSVHECSGPQGDFPCTFEEQTCVNGVCLYL